jgi:hypothetical protein
VSEHARTPVAVAAHRVEAAVVFVAVPLEEQAEVEELGQQLPVLEQQRAERTDARLLDPLVTRLGGECHVRSAAETARRMSRPWSTPGPSAHRRVRIRAPRSLRLLHQRKWSILLDSSTVIRRHFRTRVIKAEAGRVDRDVAA